MSRTRGRFRITAACAVVAISATAGGSLFATSAANASSPATLPRMTLTMDGQHITAGGTLVSGGVELSAIVKEPAAGPLVLHLNRGVTTRQFFNYVRTHQIQDPNQL